MTEGKKGGTGKKEAKKLTLKKKTLKDLDAKKAAMGVKGGVKQPGTIACASSIC